MSTPISNDAKPMACNASDKADTAVRRLENIGITAPLGYKAAGVHAGLKKRKLDLTLLVSEKPAHAAAVFTTNIVKAAPILWTQHIVLAGKPVKAIITNSGNANACTGPNGEVHTRETAEGVAKALSCKAEEVLVASTGVIGVPLPIDKVLAGIAPVLKALDSTPEAGLSAAEGIMTTDTVVKQAAVQVDIEGKTVTIGAMAKGSGMIHPNMATMLSFITTDANISHEVLQVALRESVNDSYHMISVDGDTSTNDMVVLLANGEAGNAQINNRSHENYRLFKQALQAVNQTLAEAIAKDGEGATKFLTAKVINSGSKSHARALAKAIISSSLVKSAFYGADANWGRIISAMGATGIPFSPEKVSITLSSATGELLMLDKGTPVAFDEDYAKGLLGERDITIVADLDTGMAHATAWGCDLSHDYVTINSSYRS